MDLFSKRFKQNLFLKAFVRKNIPVLAYIRPQIVEMTADTCIIKIPFWRRTRNHLNSMYFGVLSAGADLSGGMIAMNAIKQSGSPVALSFKDFNAVFLKRAEGDVHFCCTEGAAIRALVDRSISSGEREEMPVHVSATVPSISDDIVANFTLTLSLKVKK